MSSRPGIPLLGAGPLISKKLCRNRCQRMVTLQISPILAHQVSYQPLVSNSLKTLSSQQMYKQLVTKITLPYITFNKGARPLQQVMSYRMAKQSAIRALQAFFSPLLPISLESPFAVQRRRLREGGRCGPGARLGAHGGGGGFLGEEQEPEPEPETSIVVIVLIGRGIDRYERFKDRSDEMINGRIDGEDEWMDGRIDGSKNEIKNGYEDIVNDGK